MMAKPGPKGPSKQMTDKELQQLIGMMRINCTRDEICSILDMSITTLNRRLKERGTENFEALYKKHCGEGKQSLRRKQWQSAENGSVPMQIWLGKQWLGQRDKFPDEEPNERPIKINIVKPDGAD